MKRLIAVLTALFTLAVSCVAFASTDISSGGVEAEGFGAPGQPPAMGYRAAIVDARRNLLESIKEVSIDSETTVEYGLTTSDVIKSKVNGVLQGAVVTKKWKDAEGYHAIVKLDVFGGVGSLASAVIPEVQQVPLPEPTIFQNTTTTTSTTTAVVPSTAPAVPGVPVTPVTAPVRGNYTGLIVDCSGLGLSTAMAPGIYSANQSVVYGLEHLNHAQVINRGYVGYSNGMSNVGRAGANPLIVKAMSLRDNAIRPVVSDEDAMTILSENKVTGFLTAGNVVFVK